MMKLKASIYAGHKASFVRFHRPVDSTKAAKNILLAAFFSSDYFCLACMASIWSMMLFMRATIA